MVRIFIANDPPGHIVFSIHYDSLFVKGTVPDIRTEQSVVVEPGLSLK
jgi:hypothetical protein